MLQLFTVEALRQGVLTAPFSADGGVDGDDDESEPTVSHLQVTIIRWL